MKVLVIDDDAGLTALLSEYLEAEGFGVGVAGTGEQGVMMARAHAFDAVLLDIMLPGMSGFDVLRQVRQITNVPVIMLTARGDDVDRVAGLEAGADDYVPKPYYPRELVARLRAVLRRTNPPAGASREVLANGPLRLDPESHRVFVGESEVALTLTELSVLEALLRSVGRVVSKDEMSREALGRPHFPYDRSVDVHVSNIRQKLEAAQPGFHMIETIRGVGYRVNWSTS